MKLWLLRPADSLPEGDNPWEPWYDKTFGFVIRAKSEADARTIASEQSREPWSDPKYAKCEPLESRGERGVIIVDFHRS